MYARHGFIMFKVREVHSLNYSMASSLKRQPLFFVIHEIIRGEAKSAPIRPSSGIIPEKNKKRPAYKS